MVPQIDGGGGGDGTSDTTEDDLGGFGDELGGDPAGTSGGDSDDGGSTSDFDGSDHLDGGSSDGGSSGGGGGGGSDDDTTRFEDELGGDPVGSGSDDGGSSGGGTSDGGTSGGGGGGGSDDDSTRFEDELGGDPAGDADREVDDGGSSGGGGDGGGGGSDFDPSDHLAGGGDASDADPSGNDGDTDSIPTGGPDDPRVVSGGGGPDSDRDPRTGDEIPPWRREGGDESADTGSDEPQPFPGSRSQETLARQRAEDELESRLEEDLGQDLTPGEDFEVVWTGEGFRAEFTDEFRAEYSREQAREAGIDLGEQADRAEDIAQMTGSGPAVKSGGVAVGIDVLQEYEREARQRNQLGSGSIDVGVVEQLADQRAAASERRAERLLSGANALSPAQRAELRGQVAEETGLDPGEDFTVGPYGSVQMTASGRIEMAGRPERSQTWLDAQLEQFEAETGVDVIPGEGDVIQETEAKLRRAAQVHREGRGWLPSSSEAAELTEAAFPLMDPGRTQSETVEGISRRIGEVANPAAVALGAGQLAEGTAEFAFNTAVAAPGFGEAGRRYDARAGRELPPGVKQLTDEFAEVEERQAAQASTAAATAAFLGAETVRSFREQPAQTTGSALTEAGLAFLAAEASPVRFSRTRVPLKSGETATLRSARAQTPPILERAGVTPRGRTLAGLRTGDRVRGSIGPPGFDLRTIDYDKFKRGTGAFEPVSPLETESLYRRGTQELARTQSSGRLALERARAAEGIIDIGAQGRRGELIDPTTEGVVRNVRAVPEDKVDDVARALEDVDATVKGSAAVRAQLREAREPRDLDIVVADEDVARARLNEALEGSNAEVSDVFDIATTDEFAAGGDVVKFGRRAPERLETAGGVRVTTASEELIRKAGAAGFIRGEAIPGRQFVGQRGVVDVGPEPVGSGLPRYKDPADATTIARAIVAEDLDAGLLTRRQARRQADAIRRFEDLFEPELDQPSAITRGRTLETDDPAASGLVADIRTTLARIDGEDRGQVTLGLPGRRQGGLLNILRSGDDVVDWAEDIARRPAGDVVDWAEDVARRTDRPSSGPVRRAADGSPSPVLIPSGGGLGGGGVASSGVPGGEVASPSPGVVPGESGSPGVFDSPGDGLFPSGTPGYSYDSPGGFTFSSGGPGLGPSGGPGGSPGDPGSPTGGGGGDGGGGGGGGPGSPTDFPPWTPPTTVPRERRRDDEEQLPWERDTAEFPIDTAETDTPLASGWFREFSVALALGAGPREAASQEELAEAATGAAGFTGELPLAIELSGTEEEQAAIEEAQDLLFADDDGGEPLL